MASGHAKVEPLTQQDPQRIGGYVLLGRLGTGAMGRVYLGKSASGRLVAVKTIKAEFAGEADFRTRFAHEVTAAGRVSGVFTAAVVAADPDADIPWLATAYIPAPSLEQLVRECGPLPVPALRWLAAGCAEALESIHRAGLVHRDLKPSNVLVSADGPRVIDFGVARAAERVSVTATHQAVGTPAYMAPEQARDSRQTVPASDVFSLGSTLLFAATGHPPYTGDSVTDILIRLATEDPDLTGLPRDARELIVDCLARHPAVRPTAAALLARVAIRMQDNGEYEYRSTPLPDRALALIEEYRQEMRPISSATPPVGEATLDSPTSIRDRDTGPPPGARRPTAHTSPHTRDDDGGPPERTQQHSRGGVLGRVITISSAVLVAAAALVWLGIALGKGNGQPNGQPSGGPPNAGGPPPGVPPGSDPSARPSGPPRIQLNQPQGDPDTTFVIHGTGLVPGHRVAVQMDGHRTSPVKPVVDFAGTFNYVVNQSHEFFTGQIPSGTHRVTVTEIGAGRRLRVSFSVRPR